MNGWIDEWMDGWMDGGWMVDGVWINGGMNRWIDGWGEWMMYVCMMDKSFFHDNS